MIDCLLLFGASIEPLPQGTYRLKIARSRPQWPSMTWAIIVAESQDPLFDFLSFRMGTTPSCAGGLQFRTRPSRFLEPAYAKWYESAGARAVTPAGLHVDDKAVLFWLLGTIKPTVADIALPCNAPLPQQQVLCDRINTLTGWRLTPRKNALRIDPACRPAVESWLRARVPDKVWCLEK